MKEFKGTPGPWIASTTDRSVGPVCSDDDQTNGMILPVAWVEFDVDQRYQQANADLIAAAPELLEALQEIIGSGFYLSGDLHDMAEQAIKKSTGRIE